MPKAATQSFTNTHVVLEDGSVTFQCSSDRNQWPWLALHPFDPIVVQSINYWASVETGAARGTWDPEKWSALTQMRWTCGAQGVGHATHGVADAIKENGEPRYRLTFFDADSAFVYSMSGKGVVFKTRDFEAWREKAKQKTVGPFAVGDFKYASPEALGVATEIEAYLSNLGDSDKPSAEGLILKETGFTPAHPYHSGSGDHVNSNHLGDVARQFVSLLRGSEPIILSGGEMQFKRYVELGHPFQIKMADQDHPNYKISLAVIQSERLCALIALDF